MDDIVLPFRTMRSGVTGRLVRLGAVSDLIISRHDLSNAAAQIVGEALALTAMLGTALKFDGRLTLQTSSDGPLGLLVVDFETPGGLRAYARNDTARDGASDAGAATHALLGSGHLALTIDPGGDMDRYQGVVPLEPGRSLADAARTYFSQSEQLPTFLRLAAARVFTAGGDGQGGAWSWRAGGIMMQNLATEGGRGGAPAKQDEEDDDWRRHELLAATVEDHELLDPTLTPEELLYRLFHEEGVRVDPAAPIAATCRCSRERVASFLKTFDRDGIREMTDANGDLVVTCEYCRTAYVFQPSDFT